MSTLFRCTTFEHQILHCAHVCEHVLKSPLPPVEGKGSRLSLALAYLGNRVQTPAPRRNVAHAGPLCVPPLPLVLSKCSTRSCCLLKALHSLQNTQTDVLGSLALKFIAALCKYCRALLVTPATKNMTFIFSNARVRLSAVGRCRGNRYICNQTRSNSSSDQMADCLLVNRVSDCNHKQPL